MNKPAIKKIVSKNISKPSTSIRQLTVLNEENSNEKNSDKEDKSENTDDKDTGELEKPLFDDKKREKMMELAKLLSKKISNSKNEENEPVRNGETKHKEKKKKKKGKKFEGERVEYLVKKRKYNKNSDSDDEDVAKRSKSQDDFVLQKLFKKSGVHTALSHDAIVNSSDPDFLILEGEAEKVAKEALKQVKLSRRQWKTNENNRINKKQKFGAKKNSLLLDSETKNRKKRKNEESSKPRNVFGGNLSEDELSNEENGDENQRNSQMNSLGGGENSGILSSAQLLKRMRDRHSSPGPEMETGNSEIENQRRMFRSNADGYDPAYPSTADPIIVDSNEIDLDPEVADHVDLLTDIRNFVAFQAAIDGQASTSEITKRFKNRLPPDKSHIFKALLNQICDFRRGSLGDGIWHMKGEFR